MNDVHGSHALIEILAALVLSLGGAAILLRAWHVHRVGGTVTIGLAPTSAAEVAVAFGPPLAAPVLVGLLSAAAGGIHLMAGPGHVVALGDLGLGFYWAAVFQGGFAAAWIASSRSPKLAWLGIVGNACLIAAWAWSRAVGPPVVADGPEPIGVSDAIVVVLEVGIVALLAARDGVLRPSRAGQRSRALGTSGLVAIGGIAMLATGIALVDLAGGGHHDVDHAPHPATLAAA